jgi:isocitrate dehydrogenase
MNHLNDPIKFINGKLQIPDHPSIPFIEGDGSGRDIWKASRKVIDAAIEFAYKGQKSFQWVEILAGEKAFNLTGNWLPVETIEVLQKCLVGIKGPLTTPVGEGIRSLNVALRKELDLYVCMRPLRWYRGVPSPLRQPELLDVVIFRENTEDVYAGVEVFSKSSQANELLNFLRASDPVLASKIRFPETSAFSIKPISQEGSSRLVRAAIGYAIQNRRKKVTLVHKGNIMKATEGGFRKWGYQMAESEFSALVYTKQQVDSLLQTQGASVASGFMKSNAHKIFLDDVIADAAFEIALTRPGELDVIATTNLNGDYLSDALAAQVGGLGIAPGVNMNPETGAAIFEATHGTAPSLADKDLANPCSLILSAVLMLRYLNWEKAADQLEKSLASTLQAGQVTQDFARNKPGSAFLSTTTFAEKVIGNLRIKNGSN